MEGLLFVLVLFVIVLVVSTTITISKVKHRLNLLQQEVHQLSTRLEASIRSNEEVQPSQQVVNEVAPSAESSVVDPINEELVDQLTEEVKSDNSVTTSDIQETDIADIVQGDHLVIDKEQKLITNMQPLKQFKSVSSKTSSGEQQLIRKPVKAVVTPKPKSNLFTIESIISKLGIFLLLIGVGFIYKLAYDKGYVTPRLVVFMGYVFGLVVIALALRVRKKQRELLSQVLFGGGIAILYITTFAAYQGYGLMGGFLAFVILFAITFLAFFIALSIDSVAMSIVALLGGLITPFLVGIDVLGLYGMGLYMLAIAVGSMAIYIFKRWRVLQLASIVGINLITLMLTFSGDFTTKESVEFSVLLVALLAVMYGVEYMHYYLGRDYAKELFLTAIIISVLPIYTLFQVLVVLELSQVSWAIVFAIVAIIFFGLNYLLYNKRGHSILTDILMSYIGLFTLVGIILYFGGEVRYIAILILSTIFIVINAKSEYLLTRIIGLIIYAIGYGWAFYDLLDTVFDEEVKLVQIVVRLIIMVIITFIATMQRDKLRKVLGGLAFQAYLLFAVIPTATILLEEYIDTLVVSLVLYGCLIVLYIWINKKYQLLSIHSIILMSIVPFVAKVIYTSFYIYDDIDWLHTMMFVIYGVEMYILSLTLLKHDAKPLVFILKCLGYGMVSLTALIEVSVWSDHFGYGLILFICIIFAIDYIESEEDRLMAILLHVFKIAFMAIFVVYILSVTGFNDFNFIHFAFDLVMIVVFYYFLRGYLKDDRGLYIIMTVLYLLVIYQSLGDGDNGVVTLFMAAYGIISLGYFIYKARKDLVYYALGLVVLIAAKFILIDLSTIEMIWKIVTSMAFGAALLVLSYVIQPLLEKFGDGNEDIE